VTIGKASIAYQSPSVVFQGYAGEAISYYTYGAGGNGKLPIPTYDLLIVIEQLAVSN
jgi:hypothetical protein